MPNLDLAGALQIAINGQQVAQISHMGATRWSAPATGPLRTPIAATDTVGFEGNSQLVLIPGPEHGGQFDAIWPGTVARTFVGGGSLGGISDGEISDSVWAANGPGRNADFSAGGYLCINEGLLSSQFADGFPDPGTAQDNVTLTYVGGYLREATRIGADALVIVSNYPHRDYPDWDAPLQHCQFWRAHAMLHNPGDVWIFPLSWLIEDAVSYFGTNAIYADPVHLNEGTYPALLLALAHAAEYFCTRALPTAYGSLTGDTLALVDRFMPIIAGYRYAGFGGTAAPADLLYLGAPLAPGNDPLPSPGTLPGEGATAPAPPAAPTFSAITASGATVSWIAPSDGGSAITSYTLEWREVGGATTTVTDAASPEALTGLDPATDHEARVTAINAIGSSTPSAWGTFTTNAAAPTGPTPLVEITDTTYTGPSLSAGALPAGAGGFRTFTPGAPDPVASIPVTLSGAAYMIARVRSTSFSNLVYMLTLQNGAYGTWPGITMVAYGAANDWVGGIVDSAFNNTNALSGAGLSGAWQTVEVWSTGATIYISVNGSAPASASTGGTGWTANVLHLFRDEGSGGHQIDMARARLFDSVPADRAAQQAWAATGA